MIDNFNIIRVDSNHTDFRKLIIELDLFLANKNGDSNSFFAQYNSVDLIPYVVVIYEGEEAIGCGALKEYDSYSLEIKRMFVASTKRGKGIGRLILNELLLWSKELGYEKCILETGIEMREAIQLYRRSGFKVIANYGPYVDVECSICFEKYV